MYHLPSTVRVIFFLFALLGAYALALTLHYSPTFSLAEPAALAMISCIISMLILALFGKSSQAQSTINISLGVSSVLLFWIVFAQDFKGQDTYIHKLVMLTLFIHAIGVCLAPVKRQEIN